MSEVPELSIHNGVVLGPDGQPVAEQPSSKVAPDRAEVQPELSPEFIVAKMEGELTAGIILGETPGQLVHRLLTLRVGTNKLVWIRTDVMQTFKIWTEKLAGETKVRGGQS